MSRFDDALKRWVTKAMTGALTQSELARALMELRTAADADFPTFETLFGQMRKSLVKYYGKGTAKKRISYSHIGVGVFTLADVHAKLRAELDRRIMANADLIKINREQAIDKTLQRFAGWATSIPPTGVGGTTYTAIKSDLAKPAKQLRYEVRRREIDQGHKLMQSISSIIAESGGAIAYQWHSHWRQPGYDYRPDHKERDGRVYAIRNSWAHAAGLINKGDGWTDEMTQPAEEVYCQCDAVYLYALRDLPSAMLTEKGKRALEEVRRAS